MSASACASALLATFFMEEGRSEPVVSKMSNTFTILFLLGVIAELFSAFNTVAYAEGLRISGIFAASSVFYFSDLSSITLVSISLDEGTFGITAGSLISCVGGACSFASATAEVSRQTQALWPVHCSAVGG
jgi:hypothetical protein